MKKFVLIGNPVNHSLSPVMYRRAFAECGIDAQYSTERVETGDVKNKLKEFISYGFSGVNVTMPHKIEALYAVDVVDSLAETLGAVNTIVIKNGQSIGYNTDGLGFLNSIKSVFTENVEDMHVLIFGAGGMGRSAALQLAIHGCRKITLVNRSFSKSEILRNDILNLNNSLEVNITSYDILEEVIPTINLIVNATPIGMQDNIRLIPLEFILQSHFIFDTIYSSKNDTQLVQDAKSQGAKFCDGRELLAQQGAIAFEHWFNVPAPLQIMKKALQNKYNEF